MVKKLLYLAICCTLSLGNCFAQEKDSIEYIGGNIAEEMPLFNGNIYEFIQKNLIYPESAKFDSLQGVVFISFWIDTTGTTMDYEVVKGIRDDLNNEALRVTKLITFDKPAMQRGKPVKIKYTIPVMFIPDKKKGQ